MSGVWYYHPKQGDAEFFPSDRHAPRGWVPLVEHDALIVINRNRGAVDFNKLAAKREASTSFWAGVLANDNRKADS